MQVFKSRTIWTLVIMFLINGVNGLTGMVNNDIITIINVVLTALAGYFKLNPSQSYK